MTTDPLPTADRDLVDELARSVLADVAPEELAVFDDTAAEFYDDPHGVLSASGRDEAVGFGLDLALLTPYVLAVATSVLQFLVMTVKQEAEEESQSRIHDLVHRLFHPHDTGSDAPAPSAALTAAQAAQVREVALARAHDLDVPAGQARVLADAIVGGLNVAT